MPSSLNPAVRGLSSERSRLTSTFVRLQLYDKQKAIIDDRSRFTITEATTKGGKTASHIEWLLERSYLARHGNRWWIAPISDVADIAYRRTQDRLNGYIDSGGQLVRAFEPIPFYKNETRKIIYVFNSRIWFKSADNPDSLYGEDVYDAVLDEYTRMLKAAWTAVYTTLTATKGNAKLIGNVKGRKNWGFQLAREAEKGKSDWSYHKLSYHDAVAGGILDADVIEQARRDMSPEDFKQLYEADAADDAGNPFGLAAIAGVWMNHLSSNPCVAIGVDLAKSVDWTYVVGLDSGGKQCLNLRFQEPWNDTITKLINVIGSLPALVDATGVGSPIVEALQKKCPRVEGFVFTEGSKQDLMGGLKAAIAQEKIQIADETLRLELESFEYEYTRTGVRYSAPSGATDDGVMALGLAKRCLDTLPVRASARGTLAGLAAMGRVKRG